MDERKVDYCYRCRHAEARVEDEGTPFYWCTQHEKDLGPSILRLEGCDRFEPDA